MKGTPSIVEKVYRCVNAEKRETAKVHIIKSRKDNTAIRRRSESFSCAGDNLDLEPSSLSRSMSAGSAHQVLRNGQRHHWKIRRHSVTFGLISKSLERWNVGIAQPTTVCMG